MEGGERIVEQEGMCMTDKQYDGMLKDQIASLDRISKLGCDVEENGLYDKIK